MTPSQLSVMLAVYVFGFKIAGPPKSVDKAWTMFRSAVKMESPSLVGCSWGAAQMLAKPVL